MKLPAPFDTLDDTTLRIIEPVIKPVTISAGTLIFEIGAPGDSCYVIEEGLIRLEIPPEGSNPDDHENVLNYLEPGTVLGELALLDRLPRSASAYAHTDVKGYRLDSEDLEVLASTHPLVIGEIYAILGRVASLKLRAITDRLAGFIFKEANPMVDEMVARAQAAQAEFLHWPEGKVDALLKDMAQVVDEHAQELAELNVAETQIGNVPDKVLKIHVGSLGIYHLIAGQTGFGLAGTESNDTVVDVMAPMGVVFGLVPVTSPVSTFIYKSLICLKGRNALILSSSRRALRTTNRVGELVQVVLGEHSAPLDIVQWVKERNSRKTTSDFMQHDGVAFILATGGASMVKAAYSSGKPAIGVGSGNAPVYIAADADLKHAATQIVASKTFDNALACAAEHNLVVNEQVKAAFLEALREAGAAILTDAETGPFLDRFVDPAMNRIQVEFIGKPADYVAEKTGIRRDYPIRLIVVEVESIDPDSVLSREKLTPVLSLITFQDEDEGIRLSQEFLKIDGNGHTAVIYSQDAALIRRFGEAIPASRILVNAPGVQGSIGVVSGLPPAFTLGCGTFGGNSTTDNVTYRHLLNVKRLVYYAPESASLSRVQ